MSSSKNSNTNGKDTSKSTNPANTLFLKPPGLEYTSLEEQYIVRFPTEIAKKIHKLLKTNSFDKCKIQIHFDTDGTNPKVGALTMLCKDEEPQNLKVTLADLPCVVETHKTLDTRNYYKSGDIGQILLVEEPTTSSTYDDQYRAMNGLTPATHNIRKRKYRQRAEFPPDEIKEAESKLAQLQKGGEGNFFTEKEEIELIPIDEIEEIYETPKNNIIITKKEGPPIRAGIPPFNDDELNLLPKHQLERIKPGQILEDLEKDEEDDDEVNPEVLMNAIHANYHRKNNDTNWIFRTWTLNLILKTI
eukprot:TRINITY_DN5272_c0_g1_i3.p1 TRINITY_DN5272_c0_g1~~TRINITY_DN5272_c0_g1_i3.p1  ORF type:complete len:303 (+),score=58.42 TRINITY_DN5272_c0_g1_i3:18-926(+)